MDNCSIQKQKKKASEPIYQFLHEQILGYCLKPGQRLIEADLAKELGSSRTPVREAIHKLEKDGLVIVEKNKGAYVAPFSSDDMTEIYAVRKALESFAGRLAAQNMTDETLRQLEKMNQEMIREYQQGSIRTASEINNRFHEELYRNSKYKRLNEIIKQHRDYTKRLRTAVYSIPGRMQENGEEHEQILEALRLKDPNRVEALIRHHLDRAEEVFNKAVLENLILL